MKTTAHAKKPRTTNAEMSAQTQARILQATKEALSSQGYAGTSLTGVAKSLGLTQPALSYHFQSKPQLMAAVIESIYDEMAALYQAAAPESLTPAERLMAVMEEAYRQTGSVNQMAFIELLLAARRDPQCREVIAPIAERRDIEFNARWHALTSPLGTSMERLELLRDFAVSLFRGMTVCRSLRGDAATFNAQYAILRRLIQDAV